MRELTTFACLILILAACNSVVPTRTATHTFAPTSVPLTDDTPPTEVAVPSPTVPRIQDCPAAPAIQLIVQERARVTDSNETLNLRRGPGTNYDVVTRMNPSDIFTVLDGPACAGDYTWFRIRYKDVEANLFYDGWIAEGDFESYYVEPYLPG
ncbi:MAG: SH3 domain-containing protein [Anaerolineae bacterium]|nr:SH3 domain-containing protein [Anaerolineae bacterium]MDQ7037472.1 SH3 domain-containing protein [Anaerolineae bacterium]